MSDKTLTDTRQGWAMNTRSLLSGFSVPGLSDIYQGLVWHLGATQDPDRYQATLGQKSHAKVSGL